MAEKSQKESHFNLKNAQFGGGFVNAETVHAHQIGGNINNYAQKTDLVEAAAEIKRILLQLEATNPTTTSAEKMKVVAKAVDEIENNPALKAQTIAALKSEGTEAFKVTIDHPLAKNMMPIMEEWMEAEQTPSS